MSSLTWIFSFLALSLYFNGCHCHSEAGHKFVKALAVGLHDTKVYSYHHAEMTFVDALRECAVNNGALLTSVNDVEELAWISNLVKPWNPNYNSIWVGGYEVHPSFVWLNSHTKIDDALWETPTPDGDRKCAVLTRKNVNSPWKLNKGYCSEKAPFICAK